MRGRPLLALSLLPLLPLLSWLLAPAAASLSPCLGLPEVRPARWLVYAGRRLPLRLDWSPRPTHRLTTQLFRLLLEEALGYGGVQLASRPRALPAQQLVRRLAALAGPGAGAGAGNLTAVPDVMISVEVWVPPDLDVKNVQDCGTVAPPGRFGWFIPSELFNSSAGMDHWRYFTDSRNVARFDLLSEDLVFVKHLMKNSSDGNLCIDPMCKDDIFVPPQCTGDRQCALILSSFPDEAGFVTEDVKELSLYTRVLWVGSQLSAVVRALRQRYSDRGAAGHGRSLLVIARAPSDTVLALDGREFKSVSPPVCNPATPHGCPYELQRLTKLAWLDLVEGARPALEALEHFQLGAEDYRWLLQDMAHDGDAKRAACSWLRSHNATWRSWLPQLEKRNILFIGGIFPMSGTTYASRGIVRAATLALKAINSNKSILRDYELKLLIDNGRCEADIVMKTFIEYIRYKVYRKLVGILGPACSDTVEPLAGVTRHFRTIVISYSAEGASFSDRERYPYFFRTIGENKQYKHVYLQLLEQLGWRRVAALAEDGQKYAEYLSVLQDALHAVGNINVFSRKFPRERAPGAMRKYLEEMQQNSVRIIIADVADATAARELMCEAHHLRMTARDGYVWFLPMWLPDGWVEPQPNADPSDCSITDIMQAIDGHMSLTHAFFAPDEAPMEENMTVGEWRKHYRNACETNGITESNYAGYAYDAVWTYAYALDQLARENETYLTEIHSPEIVSHYVKILSETDFHGVSGRIRFMGGGPSRISTIHVVQWINNQTNFVGTFVPNENDLDSGEGRLELNMSAIVWLTPDGHVPSDGTPPPEWCVLSGLAEALSTSCEVAIVVANVIGFGLLGLFLVAAFFIVKRRYERKVQLTQNYIRSLGIDLLAASSVSELDRWEIPREHVVINRKLGEGAFGTVYGGEAHFPDNGWVAVAVKTLKVGSSTEEKLDFLSEAEVMKRFEHKNIVKLLGVCTKNEPVYTVMEFMLYGDLKTYLLARRHLVNERLSEESDDISSKKLTCMAIDVARALSYLAELKYVHRDVASRNCLVNAARTVKLGDFGMTRPMFESDYYKFNRRGMLPVRWMSPESLELGIFTPSSDVWSFGVLLYEIITFGSFPFQGLSNNEVLEHVKAGNTLTIPAGVKPQLEGLMRACWNQDYKRRPQASEIVEFLANNPRLISPSLDAPRSAVQPEDAGPLSLPAGLRRGSRTDGPREPLLPPPVRPSYERLTRHLQAPNDLAMSAL